MAAYSDFILTAGGMGLLAEVMQGGELEFRSLAAGAGAYSPEERGRVPVRAMTALKDERQRTPITSVKKTEGEDGASVSLKASLSNQGLADGYRITEVGIYAGIKGGGADVLYCVATTDEPDHMPGASAGLYSVLYRALVGLDTAEDVTVYCTPGDYVSQEDFQEAVASLKQEVTRALGGKADTEAGKGLSSNDYTDEDKEAVGGLNGLAFGQDADGNWGYKAPGAEGVEPFGGGGAVELWRNRIPPSEFGGQTVSLPDSINRYKYYEILFVSCFGTTAIHSSGRILSPYSSILECAAGLGANDRAKVIYSREFYFSQDGVSVTFEPGAVFDLKSGEADGGSTEAAIPVMILGYKQ